MHDILSFTVAGENLALPAADICEIIRPRAATRVPHAPASMIGIVNLRGTALPLLSTAHLLNRAAAAPSPAARIVIVQRSGAAGGTRLGLLVDSVASLRPLDGERVLELDDLLAREFGGLARAGTRAAAQAVAAPRAEIRVDRNELTLIGFAVDGQDYALRLADVSEVAVLPAEIAALPHTDAAMLGAAAWRGSILPVVSLRVLLGMPAAQHTTNRRSARMIVTRIGGTLVGLAVDGMRAILRVPRGDIDAVPPVLTRGRGEAQIEAIARLEGGRRLVSILSPAHLFDAETAALIAEHDNNDEAGAAGLEVAATPNAHETKPGTHQQFVVFQLAHEHYGLPIAAVGEVVRRPDQLTRVPRAPPFLEGVMNLRGRAIPVINQRQRFALPEAQATGGSMARVVIIAIEGLQAGFVVDTVSEVLSLTDADLQMAPVLACQDGAREDGPAGDGADDGGARIFDRITTVERDGRMILLINPRALLDGIERDMLAALGITAEAGPASVS